ncbi:filamentous hemagglutinin N-terminal domain-containing protein [Moorena sp. SIO3H5]|uniref:two-partner secretion domain-containing protein n=1 Tax=Moorena sp. SIO3H5 TaxID=2607834 RepID=UPI0013B9BB81|nr:filamentous hemagglutinin N-terminal domain-containing protein [Moorena sp. SIO3H5]NEO72214.1 filamentous hemagglutinin N-terminal domain-containing protein [Moorena sp. SIO3H5]
MASSLTLLHFIPSTSNQAHAQSNIVPDDTLGANGSVVIPDASVKGLPAELIEGGVQQGVNLFHSFDQFNVGQGLRVYLANPAGIENILSRVTGMNPSDIQGTLGVDGAANLFLLNPNGIIFGSNASLDVEGSFVGSTANAIAWGDDGYFSATEPESSRLLTINPGALFFNQVASVSGNIINTGTLAVGKDFTLSGLNLDLQGQLSAGGNLTLSAMETLKIRDSIALPFVAAAGGKLLLEGNQRVDILALTDPDSGLFSLGDMVLRSANPISGDAHYWSGGNFSIEDIDGSLGNLSSPRGSIIRSAGDVSFNSYDGASLQIFAGGSVTVDNVKITGSDPTNNIQETVTLSNGTTISIDGSTRPTLDIRAGTKDIGNPSAITGNPNLNQLELSKAPTTANIKIGEVIIEPPNGQVFITNQYESNSVVTGSIEVTTINTSSEVGNAGDVIIDSGKDIILIGTNTDNQGLIFADTSGPGQGGQIKLVANQEILLSDRFFLSSDTFDSGNGGEITIEAESVTVDGAVLGTRTSGEGDAGSVSIKTKRLQVLDGGRVSTNTFAQGDAGNVTINGSESVKVIGIGVSGEDTFPSLISTQANLDSTGKAGNLIINTQSLLVEDGAQVSVSTFAEGDAGSLTINASELVQVIDQSPDGNFPSGIFAQANPDSTGDAGDLKINTQQLLLQGGGQVNAVTFGEGDAGNVTINASESVQIIGVSADGNLITGIFALAFEDSTGDGGDLVINTQSLLLQDGGQVNASTFGKGDGVNLTINASESVKVIGVSPDGKFPSGIFARTVGDSTGDAGDLKINTQSLLLKDGGQISVSTFAQGDAGDVTILAQESVRLIGKSPDGKFPSGIFALAVGDSTGKGGNLIFNTQELLVFDGGRVGTTIDASLIENSLTFLPDNQIDTTTLLSNSCILRSREQPGSLIITGSGGKPTAPGSAKISPFATGTVRTIPSDGSSSSSTQPDRPWQIGDPIVEPQRVYRLADGRLVLSRECLQ